MSSGIRNFRRRSNNNFRRPINNNRNNFNNQRQSFSPRRAQSQPLQGTVRRLITPALSSASNAVSQAVPQGPIRDVVSTVTNPAFINGFNPNASPEQVQGAGGVVRNTLTNQVFANAPSVDFGPVGSLTAPNLISATSNLGAQADDGIQTNELVQFAADATGNGPLFGFKRDFVQTPSAENLGVLAHEKGKRVIETFVPAAAPVLGVIDPIKKQVIREILPDEPIRAFEGITKNPVVQALFGNGPTVFPASSPVSQGARGFNQAVQGIDRGIGGVVNGFGRAVSNFLGRFF